MAAACCQSGCPAALRPLLRPGRRHPRDDGDAAQAAIPGAVGRGGLASFIHLYDAAAATVAALEKGRAGEAYNIVEIEPVHDKARRELDWAPAIPTYREGIEQIAAVTR
jgi:nucleoside-diphosphate-sugar epimerase